MELPGVETPRTPITPPSPADITIQRGEGEPISFSDCQELARAVNLAPDHLLKVTGWKFVT